MSVQDLIVAGRRVWHVNPTLAEFTARVSERDGDKISLDLPGGFSASVKLFLPILSAAEVRGLPVGAVLVDTLTGDDCTVDWEGTPDHKVAHTEDGEYAMSSAWYDRDLVNRFALKTLPTEEA